MVTRHGQFFLIGVLLIAAVIAGTVLSGIIEFHAPATGAPQQLFQQSVQEFPTAVNTVIAENTSTALIQQRMTSYLAYQRHRFASHGTRSRSHTVIAIPDGDMMHVLLANFRRTAMTQPTITFNGTTKTADTLSDGDTRVLSFPNASATGEIQITFTADRSFNQSFSVSTQQVAALYRLRVAGEDQTWQKTTVY